jgi:eukaryotic-like serine/threonine-protein kinase
LGLTAGADCRLWIPPCESDLLGRKINNYEVCALLDKGGMGNIYLAHHPVIDRKVAIKVLNREFARDQTLVQRFLNEAKAANAIRHPNIIEMIDAGILPDGIPYLFMELLEGETLGRRIQRLGRLPLGEAVAVTHDIASALAAAHEKGIVHRDLKPQNVFLARDERAPGTAMVKVLDFGVAKLRPDLAGGIYETTAGSLIGTPPYMSPEQCAGLVGRVDQRTDVYALGIILYEMLTGQPPFMAEGFGEILMLHQVEPPRPPRELDPSIPQALEATILAALAKDREDRIQDMHDFSARLSEFERCSIPLPAEAAPRSFDRSAADVTHVVAVAPADPPGSHEHDVRSAHARPDSGIRRVRRLAVVAAGAGVASVLAAVILTRMSPSADPLPEPASSRPEAPPVAPVSPVVPTTIASSNAAFGAPGEPSPSAAPIASTPRRAKNVANARPVPARTPPRQGGMKKW